MIRYRLELKNGKFLFCDTEEQVAKFAKAHKNRLDQVVRIPKAASFNERTKRTVVHMTPKEMDRVVDRLRECGLPNMREYMRMLLLLDMRYKLMDNIKRYI